MAELNAQGHEILDDTPVAKPMRLLRSPSTLDEIRQYIGIVNREAEQAGTETFEEADDFEVGDDYDPQSPWEQSVDQEENWAAFRAQLEVAKQQAAAGQTAGTPNAVPEPTAPPMPAPPPPAPPPQGQAASK